MIKEFDEIITEIQEKTGQRLTVVDVDGFVAFRVSYQNEYYAVQRTSNGYNEILTAPQGFDATLNFLQGYHSAALYMLGK